ncbi:MAG: DUF167 domain-containing protein [Desulfomonile sp.]|nr:DUF167 domain-containing protein [Deltaproteobacteria bacterium]
MYVKQHKDGVTISVRVIPNSSRNAVAFDTPDHLAVKLTSPPVQGRANRHLVKFLGKKLGVPPSAMEIIAGSLSRQKTILVRGINLEAVLSRLGIKP